MVGVVVVSHSEDIAKGVVELTSQMAGDVKIIQAGGTFDGRIGTDIEKITNGIEMAYSEDGVIMIFDLGSALMNCEMAIEMLDDKYDKEKILIVDCALVEGALIAGVSSCIGKSLIEIKKELEEVKLNKMG